MNERADQNHKTQNWTSPPDFLQESRKPYNSKKPRCAPEIKNKQSSIDQRCIVSSYSLCPHLHSKCSSPFCSISRQKWGLYVGPRCWPGYLLCGKQTNSKHVEFQVTACSLHDSIPTRLFPDPNTRLTIFRPYSCKPVVGTCSQQCPIALQTRKKHRPTKTV